MLSSGRDRVLPCLYRETIQDTVMIIGFRHRGLERLYLPSVSPAATWSCWITWTITEAAHDSSPSASRAGDQGNGL